MDNIIDIDEFMSITSKVKIGGNIYEIRKPSVWELQDIIVRTDKVWVNDLYDAKIMIGILSMLLKNRGILWYNVWKFRKALHKIDMKSLTKVRSRCFLELGLISPETNETETKRKPQ